MTSGCGGALYVTGGCWTGPVPSPWYNEESGFLSIVVPPLLQLAGITLLFWWHQTCHDSWRCLRWGKYPAAGGTFRLCWKHHPDMGTRPHRDLIHRLHREHQLGGTS